MPQDKTETPKKDSSPHKVTVITTRMIGAEGYISDKGIPDMVDAGVEIEIDRESARILQDVGAVKIKV